VDLDLYHLAPGAPAGLQTARVLYLTPSGRMTDPLPREELVNNYPEGDRALLGATADRAPRTARRAPLRPLRFHHLLAPPETRPTDVAGLRLRLNLEGVSREDTLLLILHHPVNRAGTLAAYDLRVPPAATAKIDLTLDCRDFVLVAGAQLWMSLVSRNGASLVTGGADGSRIEILTRDRAAVHREYLAGQLRQLEEFFLSMSEPRPWGRVGADDSDLSGRYPHFEELCRMLRDARGLAPENPDLRALYLFTHPQDPANLEFARRLPIPREKDAPDWAVLARDVMGLMRHHVRWWVENKVTPNGELGMNYGDDTDFYQDIGNLVFMGGTESRLRDAILRLNEFLFRPDAITYQGQPQPLITDGLNTVVTDPLHAYEEGLNQVAMAVLMDYGNPVFLERCMAAARQYDRLFPKGPEGRYLAASDFGAGIFRQPGQYSDGALMWHPGLMLLWYNDNPVVKQQAAEYTDYITTHTNGRRVGGRYGGIDVLFAAWRHTGNERYLRALTAAFQETGVAMDARLWDYTDLSSYAAKTLEACRQVNWEASLRTTSEGISDSDFTSDEAILAYRLSGRKDALTPMLRYLYRRLTLTMPVLTHVQQSNDRVHIGKHAVDRMYLGGLALTRCMVYPHHAVSYEGLTENFAALVAENGEDRLKAVLFNFENRPQHGRMRVWRLVPGKYEVTHGPDRNDDDQPDTIAGRQTLDLLRYAPIPLDLPSRVPWVVTVRRIEQATPLYGRADLAVTAMDARWDAAAGTLQIPIHSLGAKSTGSYEVVVSDPAGKTLLSRTMPPLEAPLDLHPRIATLDVPDLRARGIASVTVTLDPGNRLEEITEQNNRATISLTGAPASGRR
jgi:hypothetical protein